MTLSNHPPRPALALSVGITGHRPPLLSPDAADAAAIRLVRIFQTLAEATETLQEKHSNLFADTPFIPIITSALAEGADQIATQVALDAGYVLQAVLPLPQEEYRKDFSDEALGRFDALLEQAERAFELPVQPGGRDEGYALAGRATVAHCDILIALWDGEPARGPGGTAEIVALAVRRGTPVLHLPMDSEEETRIVWTGYGHFIDPADMASVPTRLADKAGLTDLINTLLGPPEASGEAENLLRYLREREQLLRPRAEYPLLLASLGIKRLRRSAFIGESYREATRAEWQSFHEECAGGRHGVSAQLDGIETAFAWSDRLAQHFAQSYRSGHVLNFSLGALAVLIALSGLLFPQIEFWAALCETLAITGFVINTLVGTRRQWHRRWLEYRQLAERLRPMRSLKLLGVAVPPGPMHGEHQVRRWVDWYANAQWRAAGCSSGVLMDSDALSRAIIAEEIKPQIDYHRSSALQMHRLDHRLHQLGMLFLIGSVLGCFSSVTANFFAHDFAVAHAHVFIALSAGMPAMGAAIFGIRMQGDFGASAERSLITASSLDRIVEALATPGIGLARQTVLAEAAAATMLSELDNWHHAYSQRRLELP
jgi:hypothetical protein